MNAMRCIYDPDKQTVNLKKHGLSFDDAQAVIESSVAITC